MNKRHKHDNQAQESQMLKAVRINIKLNNHWPPQSQEKPKIKRRRVKQIAQKQWRWAQVTLIDIAELNKSRFGVDVDRLTGHGLCAEHDANESERWIEEIANGKRHEKTVGEYEPVFVDNQADGCDKDGEAADKWNNGCKDARDLFLLVHVHVIGAAFQPTFQVVGLLGGHEVCQRNCRVQMLLLTLANVVFEWILTRIKSFFLLFELQSFWKNVFVSWLN